MRFSGRFRLVSALLLLSSVLLFYVPMFDNGFLLDDYLSLKNAYFGGQELRHAVGPWFPGFHRPVSQLLFTLEFALFGFGAPGYYAANLLLHLLNSMLVVLLTLRLTGHDGKALLAGMLFSIGWAHYGKGVIWISDSFGLVATFFYVSCLVTFLAFLEGTGARRRAAYVVSAACFLLAIFAKESTLSLLPVLVIADRLLAPGKNLLRVRRFLPHAAVGLAYIVVVWLAVEDSQLKGLSASLLWRSPLDALRYLVLAIFPVQTSPLIGNGGGALRLLLAISPLVKTVLAAGILAGSVLLLRRGPAAHRFLLLGAVLAVLPFTAVPQVRSWLNLRYLYLPAVFLAPLVASLIVDGLVERGRSGLGRVLAFTIPLLLVLETNLLMRRLEKRYDVQSYSIETLEDLERECGGELVPPGADSFLRGDAPRR